MERLTGVIESWVGRWALGRAALGAMDGYSRHATSQFSAAISYRMLFSLVPLVSFLTAIADAVLPEKQQTAFSKWIASIVPGNALDSSVQQALAGSRVTPTVAGLVSLAILLWAASGMMGAIRIAFRVIWENNLRRTFVESKLLDVVLVMGVGLVAVAALGTTLLVHVLAEIGKDLSDKLGGGGGGQVVAGVSEILASGAVTFGVVVVLYRFVPPVRPRFRAIWPPALLATIGFHLATAVYALYLARFGDLSTLYGPLGAVLGFLLVVYVGVIVILLGAELVAAWPPISARPGGAPPRS